MSDKCFLVLGGGGMVGFQVAHRIARRLEPEKVIIASLYQQEVRKAIKRLRRDFLDIEFVGFWGDVFVRSDFNVRDREQRLNRVQLLQHADRRAELFEDLFGDVDGAYQRSQLVQLILKHRPDVIVDSINTATAISYQDIYTATKIAKRDLDSFLEPREIPIISRGEGGQRKSERSNPESLSTALAQSVESLMISQYTPQLIRHVVLMYRAMCEVGTRLYVKIGTTGTGGMGLNIPYTHGEDKPSAKLMSKTAIAFAHTGLMFLMARTLGGPIVKEIKPAAMVGWVDITLRTAYHDGKPAHVFTSRAEPLKQRLALRLDEKEFKIEGKLQMPVVDTGENGLFAKGEFEAITALRQMEFMTPEEIARVVELEIKGINTGKDVIAAVDGAVMGPTYRAGYLRYQALREVERLEAETQNPSVALGKLGPPELSKLLWEAYLLKQCYGTLTAVLEHTPQELADLKQRSAATPAVAKRSTKELSWSLHRYLQENVHIQNIITSVGIPILLPDGSTILRGPFIRIPEVAGQKEVIITNGDIERWAAKGWVDLRWQNMARWQERFEHMRRVKEGLRGKGSAAVRRTAYLYDEIHIGEVVGWVFNNEMGGYRIK